nr:ribosome-recycling factor [Blattabacterium sp. (Blatta orientalis)]
MEKIFKQLQEEIHRIRLGSKSVVPLLEKIKIKCYASFFPLIEVATITIVDNMNITIHPWDRAIISYIDKAIIDENLGFMPTNKGESIHIRLPILTEEGRKNLMKKLKQKQKSKIFVRTTRKKYNQSIKRLKISEDLSKTGENRIQKITKVSIQKIDVLFFSKEKEILSI